MLLPESFAAKMQELLQEEYADFLASYSKPRYYGLRVNTLKWSVTEALDKLPLKLSPVDWVNEGFYYNEEDRPAKHPFYQAGLYYIQEPSAMAPGAVIPVKPGDRVLDMCAAPGGKSTQVAAKLGGSGLLVSNDINAERVKALMKNIDLSGIRNGLITNTTPEKLAQTFPQFFDCVLIDAPCSGEGMFRKNPEMIKDWEKGTIEQYALMQRDILDEAALMVRPGGVILYSTCTFAPEENEQQITSFLRKYPQFELEPIVDIPGFDRGKREWTGSIGQDYPLEHTVRLWPHRIEGEGHYLALMRRNESYVAKEGLPSNEADEKAGKSKLEKTGNFTLTKEEKRLVAEFEEQALTRRFLDIQDGDMISIKGHIYIKPKGLPLLHRLKVIKSGWYLGEVKKNRFEPSQPLALGLEETDVKRAVHFSADDEDLYRYLKGETIFRQGEKGWTLVTVAGFPLGWAKQVQDILKNAYPPGWRWLT
ncbi:RsmB/NOP family class I SAM-dependent RNA methyltransferase [Bacillus horti]|uniref:NOL1/NOP2/sun family putative RNA methylase n=1 Tax=Caldalkalibacillus horti TaxID=77523 RepID=A0ABT9VWP9_9BACI|nr:RsmB/NOP family class I SAM-dependent RNA methyltransferase [Bacillus horti]MDQ0165421.1 NOL1/NOP2/sun family putative RNA methylase [Bacillus horti]